jgi:signal transduction histidine kinase/ActR/RegA family two-component response regulator
LKADLWGLVVGEILLFCILTGSSSLARGSRAAFIAGGAPLGLYMIALVLIGLRLDPGIGGALCLIACTAGAFAAATNFHNRALLADHALDEARRKAEAATAAKSAFVAMVSHELRTPISGILAGAAELERTAGDAAGRANANLILDSGRMMRSLLDDLLDLAKMEAGRMSVEQVAFDLRRALLDGVRFWRPAVRSRGLRLTIAGARAVPLRALGDPLRLRQILNNLMSNALKFTDAGGIQLRVEVQPGDGEAFGLVIEVVDTGPGMDAAQLSRLFQAFEQLTPGAARTHGGTGLGLNISRELARLMGGDLTAHSAPGQGATFRLALPLVRAPAAATDAAVPRLTFTGPLKVLIADDHAVNRQAFQLILQSMDAQVATAEDGQAALNALSESPFDLVLMDLNMPILGGMEATRRLRAAKGPNARTPVIALTASTSPTEVNACLAAGMDAFLMKPVETAELLAVIEETLAARARAPEGFQRLGARRTNGAR